MKKIKISLFTLFFIFGIQSDEGEKLSYRFITAKTGLNLRLAPDTESESLGFIPSGKIVRIVRILDETVNIKGTLSPWALVKYSWKEGYVVSAFLHNDNSFEDEEIKPLKKSDIIGKWKGEWKWEKNYTHIHFKKNNFVAYLFDGGDDSAYTGHSTSGTWKLNTDKKPNEICLKTKQEDVCFYLFDKKLVVNLDRPSEQKNLFFTENFGHEILSGLVKEK
jgi:hypothetical protein